VLGGLRAIDGRLWMDHSGNGPFYTSNFMTNFWGRMFDAFNLEAPGCDSGFTVPPLGYER